ncbi:MAG: AMP-dependent synthetase/ligase [Solirubrobacterales bacterium]
MSTDAKQAKTVAEAVRTTAAGHPDEVWVKTRDGSVSYTWSEGVEQIDRIAGGMRKLGVGRGDTVGIMLVNRPEFHPVDLGVVTAGGTPFSIYQTYTAEQIEYLLNDAATKVIVTEKAFLPVVQEACADVENSPQVVLIDPPEGGAPDGIVTLEELEAMDPGFDGAAAAAEVTPEDVLTLIYTSGTTGPPKGVQLSHENLLTMVASSDDIVNFPPRSRVISWLPAAHIAERGAHHYLPVIYGFEVTTVSDPRSGIEVLPELHPQSIFAVPRIWEKLKSGLEGMLASQEGEAREALETAIADATEKVRLEQAGKEVPADLAERVAEADEKYFAGLRATLGLDQVVTINVGAAPTPLEVLEFFHAIGLPLAELWGMSETSGVGTVNPPEKVKLGTVGPPLPGVELKLADDGELLIRGGLIMLGYRNMPEATAEAIDAEGWLHTGDIAEIDEDGYVKIVYRKKELIINAAGKNMSPANIEAEIKSASPLIDQVCCIGDARPYNTALISLDADVAPSWAGQQGIEDASIAALSENEQLLEAIQAAVDEGNTKLARVEQIKKFKVLPAEWGPGGDELTPTSKLRRKPIAEKYSAEIEELYA